MKSPQITPLCSFSVFERKDNYETEVFVLKHPLSFTGEQIVVGTGKNVRVGDVRRFFNRVCNLENSKKRKTMTWLHPNIVAYAEDSVVWRIPSGRRTLFFKIGNNIRRMEVPFPELVAYVREQDGKLEKFKVWAIKQYEGVNTELFHAPLMNFYQDGSMCWGSVKKPKLNISDLTPWEDVIFDSINTHVNHKKTLFLNDGEDVESYAFIRAFEEIQAKEGFPNDWLFPVGLKLGDVVEGL